MHEPATESDRVRERERAHTCVGASERMSKQEILGKGEWRGECEGDREQSDERGGVIDAGRQGEREGVHE